MRFYFTAEDANLRKAASAGGCGVTPSEVAQVQRWQRNMNYQFEFHLENHGPYVYVFPDGRRAGQKNMPRFYFGGGREDTFDNDESLSQSVKTDVEEVVKGNKNLFAAMHGRFYGTSGIASKATATDASRQFHPLSKFVCPICRRDYTVEFNSHNHKVMNIMDRQVGGIRHTEYPVIRCTRMGCGFPLELVAFLGEPKDYPKERIKYDD